MSSSSTPSPWNPVTEPVPLGDPSGFVMLVDGQSFCLGSRNGDLDPRAAQGLFIGDLRVLSTMRLRVGGRRVEPLAVYHPNSYMAVHVGRVHRRSGSLLVIRRRVVGTGLREELELRSYDQQRGQVAVALTLDADFADLFAVKEGRVVARGERSVEVGDEALTFSWRNEDAVRRTVVTPHGDGVAIGDGELTWQADLAAHEKWSACVEAQVIVGTDRVPSRARCGEPVSDSLVARRSTAWRRRTLRCSSANGALDTAIHRSVDDLGSLRLFDPTHHARPVIAAGAPWFMTLFGRDALISAWMALPVDPGLAVGVLETLGQHQGEVVDPRTDEQPGRILHEMRFGAAATLSLGGGHAYYGTADATPLFVMLLAELDRWVGLDTDRLKRLLPVADRALDWIDQFGDRDHDGYVEYLRGDPAGLRNQGWKDSWDGVRFADGRIAEPPIALCEVQAYVYGAWRARAHIARRLDQPDDAQRFDARADDLRERFHRDFWLADRGLLAFGLDRDKRPIDGVVSNAGHALWTGLALPEVAEAVADRFLRPGLWSGWGVRTMSERNGGYDPLSYHCGSVWPHDNAICAEGFRRYGLTDAAQRVVLAQLAAAQHFGGRLPELFSGLGRHEVPVPVRYPTSCSPQAWAAASPLLHLRSLLGIDPDIGQHVVHVDPALPPDIGFLRLRRVSLAGAHVDIDIEGDMSTIRGLPPGINVEWRAARKP